MYSLWLCTGGKPCPPPVPQFSGLRCDDGERLAAFCAAAEIGEDTIATIHGPGGRIYWETAAGRDWRSGLDSPLLKLLWERPALYCARRQACLATSSHNISLSYHAAPDGYGFNLLVTITLAGRTGIVNLSRYVAKGARQRRKFEAEHGQLAAFWAAHRPRFETASLLDALLDLSEPLCSQVNQFRRQLAATPLIGTVPDLAWHYLARADAHSRHDRAWLDWFDQGGDRPELPDGTIDPARLVGFAGTGQTVPRDHLYGAAPASGRYWSRSDGEYRLCSGTAAGSIFPAQTLVGDPSLPRLAAAAAHLGTPWQIRSGRAPGIRLDSSAFHEALASMATDDPLHREAASYLAICARPAISIDIDDTSFIRLHLEGIALHGDRLAPSARIITEVVIDGRRAYANPLDCLDPNRLTGIARLKRWFPPLAGKDTALIYQKLSDAAGALTL